MIRYYLPVVLIVGSNALYHICARGVPRSLNPMLALMSTYLVAFLVTAVLFFTMGGVSETGFTEQVKTINWAPVTLGVFIVGLEVGFIYLYRVGWDMSIGPLVCNILLAVVLIGLGVFLYKEIITRPQMLGIALCAVGLIFINKK